MNFTRKILFIILLFAFNCKRTDNANNIPGKVRDLEIKGLNFRITNDLSDFKYSDYIENQTERFIQRHEMAGLSMVIIKDEKLVYAQGFGFSDKENEIKVSPGNIFRLASVSKLITAIGILKLVEDHKLSLDSKVFGPDAVINDSIFTVVRDRRLKDITVRQLLAHSGGWSQRYGDPAFNSLSIAEKVGDTPPASINTYFKYIASRRLHFAPGSRVSYSNMGYMFLGEVISRASGKPYEEYIKDEILLPNGITDMHIGSSTQKDKRFNEVKYYEQKGSWEVPSYDGNGEYVAKSYGGNPIELLGPAGGWVASSVELGKLLLLVDGWQGVDDIIPNNLFDDMISTKYAQGPLGWRTVLSNGNWWRTGSMAGTSAMLKRRNDGITWIVLCNSSSWQGPMFSNEIHKFMGKLISRVKHWPEHDLFQYYPLADKDA